MMKTVCPIFHNAPPDPIDLIRSSNHVSDTRNLKMGERQSCEQLVDADEPHAEQMKPTSNSVMNNEPHAAARQYLNNKHLHAKQYIG
jgi:hypothetical protein